MSDYRRGIQLIMDPKNIREALYASSPYVLRVVFDNDPIVRRLVEGGQSVIKLIEEEMERKDLDLEDITLACFAYILQKVSKKSAARILRPFFVRAMENPGPFFVHFAAAPLRDKVKRSKKPLGETLTRKELEDTLKVIISQNEWRDR